jgi:hypothetical protein
MTFSDFRKKYPHLTKQEAKAIAGCSMELINRWWMTGATRSEPSPVYMERFIVADWLWSAAAHEPESIQRLRAIKAAMDDRSTK